MNRKTSGQDPLRTAAEEKLARAPPEDAPIHPAELLHELQVHQIELEMQNEALRQAQIVLEESRDRYVDLYEFAPAGYLTLDRAGLIKQANLTGAGLLDVERKKLLGRRFAHLVGAEDRDRWERLFLSMMERGGDGQSADLELLRGNGTRFHARLNGLRVDADDAPPTARIVLTDVSPLKRAEARAEQATLSLQKERDILQTVMNGAKAAHLAYLDTDFNFVRVNETFAATRGYTPEQMVGKNYFALYPDPETASRFAQAKNTGTAAEGIDQPFIFPDRPERGTTYWDWMLIPVDDRTGEVHGLVFSLVETTQRVRREAECIHSLEEQRDTLVREVHHRIKNHLQGVVGLLRASIYEQCDGCPALEKAIDQIGAIAKAYGLQSDGKDARTTVEQLVRMAAEGLACPVAIEVRSSAEMPPSLLAGDETVAMALVINELLTNAVKHSPADARRVSIRLEEEAACSRIRVENGPAFLPAGFDWASGLGLGTGLELLRTLIPGKGASLSYRQENDTVIADLALSVPVIDRERREAIP